MDCIGMPNLGLLTFHFGDEAKKKGREKKLKEKPNRPSPLLCTSLSFSGLGFWTLPSKRGKRRGGGVFVRHFVEGSASRNQFLRFPTFRQERERESLLYIVFRKAEKKGTGQSERIKTSRKRKPWFVFFFFRENLLNRMEQRYTEFRFVNSVSWREKPAAF